MGQFFPPAAASHSHDGAGTDAAILAASTDGATASGTDAVAAGRGSVAAGLGSVAAGRLARAQSVGSVGLGNFANGDVVAGIESIALGTNAKADGARAIAIGRLARAQFDDSMAIGEGAVAAAIGETKFGGGNNPNRVVFRYSSYKIFANFIELENDGGVPGLFQATVGAAGAGAAPPASPVTYLRVRERPSGTFYKIPLYND